MIRNETATATSWVVLSDVDLELDHQAAGGLGRARPQLGRKFGNQRPQRDPAIFLHFREMVAVDDGKGADPAADPGIGRARSRGICASAMDVEQRGDDLQVVLHPMVDFAHQPSLPFQRARHLALRFLDLSDNASERVPQLLDLLARTDPARQLQLAFARPVREDCALQALQRGDEQATDQRQVMIAAAIHIRRGSSRTSRSRVVIR